MKNYIKKGSIILFEKNIWLFMGYGKNEDSQLTYRIINAKNEVDEVLASDCIVMYTADELLSGA